jgi:hypothetical protein
MRDGLADLRHRERRADARFEQRQQRRIARVASFLDETHRRDRLPDVVGHVGAGRRRDQRERRRHERAGEGAHQNTCLTRNSSA